jgi:hypothetical protein
MIAFKSPFWRVGSRQADQPETWAVCCWTTQPNKKASATEYGGTHEERSDKFTAVENRFAGYEVYEQSGSKIGKIDDPFVDESQQTTRGV